MSCSQPNFGYWDQSSSGGSAGSFDSAVASPYLIVGNCPETLTSVSGPLTLYKGELLGRTPIELARQKKCPGIISTFTAAGIGL